jgi:hypothetical protein
MLIVTYSIVYVVKTFWCQLPEDGEIIVTKHVAAIIDDCMHTLYSAFVGVT